jgi:hypothetical protein
MPTHPLASPPISLTCGRSIPDDTPNLNEVPGERLHRYLHTNNLARPHESLREPVLGLKAKYRDRTPAMALGLTDRVLTVGDILRMPLIPAAA